MARRAPVFASAGLVNNRFPEFKAMIESARSISMREAGAAGAREARQRYQEQRRFSSGHTPSTLQTINYRTDGAKVLIIYVGTLRGAVFEYGAENREGRGTQPPRPYLRPGADMARSMVLPGMAARLPHGRKRV